MTREEIIADERYHTCGRCKWEDIPYICHRCRWGEDTRKDLWELKEDAEGSKRMTDEETVNKPHIEGDYYDGFKNGLRTAKWRYDKIRAEILDEAEYAYADFDQYKEDILHAESDELPDDDFRYGLERAVNIIDKYKAESEERNDE